MNVETLKKYCDSKKSSTNDFPFDNETLVYRIGSKIFALIRLNSNPLQVNLKCDPYMAQCLRFDYPSITPGYHMNKKYWNTLNIDGSLSDEFIEHLIDISYDVVFNSLAKRLQKEILET
ncbi:MmcQ/YjbR family DNA-binding protein [Clostridium tunisiense]|uniref:MmcQ/YjbR family DNA-binding protein n=1 Tax=Clostridium tunisiense TaxID=219748 RepID=UPI00030F94FA|nr:MmcQ/YjbR family DNA-binding protein [Clostridium tunisiense]